MTQFGYYIYLSSCEIPIVTITPLCALWSHKQKYWEMITSYNGLENVNEFNKNTSF